MFYIRENSRVSKRWEYRARKQRVCGVGGWGGGGNDKGEKGYSITDSNHRKIAASVLLPLLLMAKHG